MGNNYCYDHEWPGDVCPVCYQDALEQINILSTQVAEMHQIIEDYIPWQGEPFPALGELGERGY